MALLPQQILPETNPIGTVNQNGQVQIDHNWWLLLYNLCQQVLGIGGQPPANILPLIDAPMDDALSAQAIGIQIYPITPAEIAATVRPTYYSYPAGDLRRYGALVNGSSDDTAAVNSAQSANANVFVPLGVSDTSIVSTNLSSNFYGFGQIETSGGNKRGKTFSAIKQAPSSLGNYTSIETAFNGDWSHVQDSTEYRITGAATLGQPSTGYVYTPEASPHYTYLYNASGWNQDTGDNIGRTAATAYRVQAYQAGEGDAVCFNGSVAVGGSKSGATSFLANPAGVLFNGDVDALNAGVYLNPVEIDLNDGGFDVAGIGAVYNFARSVNTGALSAVWLGLRFQSTGADAVDSLMSAVGDFNNGIDFSMTGLNFGSNQAAISLKSGQRIYLNNNALASGNLAADWTTTGYNGDYIYYNGSATVLVNGGTATFESQSSGVIAAVQLKCASTFLLTAATGGSTTGQLALGTTTGTSATAGSQTLPTNPLGFLIWSLGGTTIKIPYYSA